MAYSVSGDSAFKYGGIDDKSGFQVDKRGGSATNARIDMEDRGDNALMNYPNLEDKDISNLQNNDTSRMKRNSSTKAQHDISTKYNLGGHVNGENGLNRAKLGQRFIGESVSPANENGKRWRYHDDDDYMEDHRKKSSNGQKSSAPETAGDKNTVLVLSPSRDRNHDIVHARSRSMSHDHARERSPSDSIIELQFKRRHDNNGTACDSVGDLPRQEKREHSTSNSRYARDGDSSEARKVDGIKDRDIGMAQRKEREPNRSRDEGMVGDRRNRERERSRDRVRRREKEEERIGEKERERIREKERERIREKERERIRVKEHERIREKQQERIREKERERATEKDRERSGDEERGSIREKEQDRSREKERERSRERDLERDRRRHNERGRSWDRHRVNYRYIDRERDRESENEANKGRDRKRASERSRDKVRDPENDRNMYDYYEDGYVKRDSFRHSRHSRYDEKDNELDKKRKKDSPNSESAYFEKLQDRKKKEEDEQEDFEERVALQLADQEEEDIERIKEESRRRRQAILEKYKNQQLQQKIVPQMEDGEKDKEPSGHSSHPSASALLKVHEGKSGQFNVHVGDRSDSVRKSPLQNGIVAPERDYTAGGLGEGTPKSERSDDMFHDDIFGESPAGVRKSQGRGDGLQIEKSGLHDNWDDADGYYCYRFGEVLDGRYEIISAHGKGVFSTVVRARDLKSGMVETEEVAIKIIRSNLTKACVQELGILKKLVGADPEDKRHCVRFLSSFKYRNHLCLVFESLHMNLREHLRNCGVLHCDIKPDNMLVNEAKNVLKLCDFGNAMFAGKNEITPYLVSRFYRAPEIILGLPYDHPLDIWSVGCCLYELYTGKVLFPGATNNDMVRLHMELKGPFPKKMLRKGGFIDQHFDQDLNFHATEEDPVTKKTIKRIILNVKPTDIGSIISGSLGEDPKMVANFRDLLDKIFILDPEKRLTVSQALNHPFITGK